AGDPRPGRKGPNPRFGEGATLGVGAAGPHRDLPEVGEGCRPSEGMWRGPPLLP
ncbi:hypothetical protein NL676_027967, partial [Syzygium grande]